MWNRKTTEQFIIEAISVHGNRYDYSLVAYKNNKTKVTILCKKHGVFLQSPEKHLMNRGCPKCGREQAPKSKTLTNKKFIQQAINVHGEKYDYSMVDYQGCRKKVQILCEKHGTFLQAPTGHLCGRGCPKCGVNKRAKDRTTTNSEFIAKAISVHGDLYDYSQSIYIKGKHALEIICKKHGVFHQVPNNHLSGAGCPKCGQEKTIEPRKTTKKGFIERSTDIHGKKYDYSLVVYSGTKIKVKIVCATHGMFWQSPESHMEGSGCPKCKADHVGALCRKSVEQFIKEAISIHGSKYDYSRVDYKNNKTHIKILCKTHGIFEQSPDNHLQGNGCPRCAGSIGELRISSLLTKWGINHETQKRFKSCRNIKPLPFDFYLPSLNILIEYDGAGHFECVSWTSDHAENQRTFQRTQANDKIKTQFCIDNGIPLIRIPYTCRDIESTLAAELSAITGDLYNNLS